MGERTLAKRYARALLEVAKERNEIDRVENELHAVARLWATVPELRLVLGDPARSRAEKQSILEKLFAARVSHVVLRFLAIVLEKGRFARIEEIAAIYDELSDELQGIARARVTSAMPLEPGERDALVARLRKFTERPNVILDEKVDPDLLGGVIVRIGDQVIDGSVRGRLRALRERLIVREEERATAAMAMALEAL